MESMDRATRASSGSGLPPEVVAKISGDVPPEAKERELKDSLRRSLSSNSRVSVILCILPCSHARVSRSLVLVPACTPWLRVTGWMDDFHTEVIKVAHILFRSEICMSSRRHLPLMRCVTPSGLRPSGPRATGSVSEDLVQRSQVGLGMNHDAKNRKY